MIEIKLYDRSNIDALEWPNTPEAQLAFAHLLPMIKEGVKAYIQNVDTQLYLLKVNDRLLPLTVNEKEYSNSYVVSNYFSIAFLIEQLKKKPSWLNPFKLPFLKGGALLLKGIKINKMIIVNNWLLTNNIYSRLDEEQLKEVTNFLTHRFPRHVIFFRSLNQKSCCELTQFLEKQKYRLFYSRNVSIYDPSQKEHFSSKVHYHHRRDRRLIETDGYQVIQYKNPKNEEIEQLLKLYNSLYIERHTKYSPQYTEKFLKMAVEKGFLDLVCLKKEGVIRAVIGFYEREGILIAPFCGYELADQEGSHLYRMLTMLAIDEAEKRQSLLNDGSGGEAPKQYRGMKSFPEYVALYDRHLPFHHRIFWSLAEIAVKQFAIGKINSSE
jgi:hypothetical protein